MVFSTVVADASRICCTDPQRGLSLLAGVPGEKGWDNGSRLWEISSRTDWRHAAMTAVDRGESWGTGRAGSMLWRLDDEGDCMVWRCNIARRFDSGTLSASSAISVPTFSSLSSGIDKGGDAMSAGSARDRWD